MTVSDIDFNEAQLKLSDYRTSSNLTVVELAEILNMRAEAIFALEQGDHDFFGDKGFATIFLRRYLAHFCVCKSDADLIEQRFLSTEYSASVDKVSYKKLMILSLSLTVGLSYITLQNSENYFFNKFSVSNNKNLIEHSDDAFVIVSSKSHEGESSLVFTKNSFISSVNSRSHRNKNINAQRDYNPKSSKNKVSSFKFESPNRILFTDVANVIIKDKYGYVVFAAKTFPGMSALLPDAIKNLNVVSDKNNSWVASL